MESSRSIQYNRTMRSKNNWTGRKYKENYRLATFCINVKIFLDNGDVVRKNVCDIWPSSYETTTSQIAHRSGPELFLCIYSSIAACFFCFSLTIERICQPIYGELLNGWPTVSPILQTHPPNSGRVFSFVKLIRSVTLVIYVSSTLRIRPFLE